MSALILSSVLVFFGIAWVATVATGPAQASSGIRLIMVDEPGCYYCKKWNTEIGRGYSKSAEGRFAPLKRVRRGAKEIKGLTPVVFTPTFIVMRRDEEVGRITGYPGKDYFYTELGTVLSSAGFIPGGW